MAKELTDLHTTAQIYQSLIFSVALHVFTPCPTSNNFSLKVPAKMGCTLHTYPDGILVLQQGVTT